MSSSEYANVPKLTTELPPPFINLATLPNLRDFGGQPIQTATKLTSAAAAARVRNHALYRSADPSRISSSDLSRLHSDLGVSTIFDLRSLPEIERSGQLPSYEATLATVPAVRRIWTPVFAAEDYSPEAVALRFRDYGAADDAEAGFVRAYAQILQHAGPALNSILSHLAEPGAGESGSGGRGILVHCTAGKDRAGCVVAVILSLLGVTPDAVAEEYSLTERGLGDLKEYFVQRLLANGAFEQSEEGRRAAERMVGARAEAMQRTLQLVQSEYGSVEGYVRKVVGLDSDSIERIRRNYIVSDEMDVNYAAL